MAGSFGVWLSVTPHPERFGTTARVSGLRGGGTAASMNSDTIIAMSGLMGLAAAVLTGALWDTPLVMAPFRWFVS
jgi:hypothetical protein